MFEIAFFWLGFAIVVGVFASRRGRSGFGWFVLALFFTPVLVGLLLAVLPKQLTAAEAALEAERPTPETHVRCPDCRELVRKDALRCKHCGCGLVPQ